MKRLATLALATLLLFPTIASAQSSSAAASPVNKNQVIARLLKEVDDGRAYISTLQEREKALREELAAADNVEARLTEAYKASLVELGELRAEIKFRQAAADEREKQVEALRSENEQLTKKLKSARKREVVLGIIGFVSLLRLIL